MVRCTLSSAVSSGLNLLAVGTGEHGRDRLCAAARGFSAGPAEPVLNYGHLSVTISRFDEFFYACLAEMVSCPILQAVQAAASAAASFSLCCSNSIHTWMIIDKMRI